MHAHPARSALLEKCQKNLAQPTQSKPHISQTTETLLLTPDAQAVRTTPSKVCAHLEKHTARAS